MPAKKYHQSLQEALRVIYPGLNRIPLAFQTLYQSFRVGDPKAAPPSIVEPPAPALTGERDDDGQPAFRDEAARLAARRSEAEKRAAQAEAEYEQNLLKAYELRTKEPPTEKLDPLMLVAMALPALFGGDKGASFSTGAFLGFEQVKQRKREEQLRQYQQLAELHQLKADIASRKATKYEQEAQAARQDELRWYDEQRKNAEDVASELYDQGWDFMRIGDFDSAVKAFQEANAYRRAIGMPQIDVDLLVKGVNKALSREEEAQKRKESVEALRLMSDAMAPYLQKLFTGEVTPQQYLRAFLSEYNKLPPHLQPYIQNLSAEDLQNLGEWGTTALQKQQISAMRQLGEMLPRVEDVLKNLPSEPTDADKKWAQGQISLLLRPIAAELLRTGVFKNQEEIDELIAFLSQMTPGIYRKVRMEELELQRLEFGVANQELVLKLRIADSMAREREADAAYMQGKATLMKEGMDISRRIARLNAARRALSDNEKMTTEEIDAIIRNLRDEGIVPEKLPGIDLSITTRQGAIKQIDAALKYYQTYYEQIMQYINDSLVPPVTDELTDPATGWSGAPAGDIAAPPGGGGETDRGWRGNRQGLRGQHGQGQQISFSGGESHVGQVAASIFSTAKGTPYKWGGSDIRRGVDCSGLICEYLKRIGISTKRETTLSLYSSPPAGLQVVSDMSVIQPGDILVFRRSSGTGHAGVVLPDGTVMHSSSSSGVVASSLDSFMKMASGHKLKLLRPKRREVRV